MKRGYRFLLGIACLLVAMTGAYYSRAFFDNSAGIEGDNIVTVYANADEVDNVIEVEEELPPIRIDFDTKMTLRHVDRTTGEVTESTEFAPSFMVNKTREDLEGTFTAWEVVSFSEAEVVMERKITPLPQVLYTIAIADGQIVVFKGVRSDADIYLETGVSPAHLPAEDQSRLEEGIFIFTETDLIRRLEDFLG